MYLKSKAGWYYQLIFHNFFLYTLKITQNATGNNDMSLAYKLGPHFELMLS